VSVEDPTLIATESTHVGPTVEYVQNVEPDTGNELSLKLFANNPVAENGGIRPPSGPGLGVEAREDVAAGLVVHDGHWRTS
jgi:L-alanine-DL-glutamate epimerase-like enolase superfamily enzyme